MGDKTKYRGPTQLYKLNVTLEKDVSARSRGLYVTLLSGKL